MLITPFLGLGLLISALPGGGCLSAPPSRAAVGARDETAVVWARPLNLTTGQGYEYTDAETNSRTSKEKRVWTAAIIKGLAAACSASEHYGSLVSDFWTEHVSTRIAGYASAAAACIKEQVQAHPDSPLWSAVGQGINFLSYVREGYDNISAKIEGVMPFGNLFWSVPSLALNMLLPTKIQTVLWLTPRLKDFVCRYVVPHESVDAPLEGLIAMYEIKSLGAGELLTLAKPELEYSDLGLEQLLGQGAREDRKPASLSDVLRLRSGKKGRQ